MIPTYRPNTQMVKELWKHMSKKYDVTVVQKKTSRFMKLVAWFLSTFKILDKERFLTRYTTTIGTKIYAPFTPGARDTAWSLPSQIATIVHEIKHALQYRNTSKSRIGDLLFFWRYLTDDWKRTNYEIEAYILNMELFFWAAERVFQAETMATKLYDYNCDQVHVTHAKEAYSRVNVALLCGEYEYDPIVKEAIDWMNTQGQHYLRP